VTIGIVFQFFQLLPMLSLLENVMLPMDFCNRYPAAEREGRARALLEQVGLGDMVDKLPGAVSGGQQQAAAIARALANDPPLIIADEPTGNLDERTAEGVLALFDQLVARGKTVVIVTHDPALVKRTQRTILLSDGEIIHPMIARAFPRLAHPQMLQLTHLARPRPLARGESLTLPPYAPGLLVLTQGKLALWKPARRGETLWMELHPAQALTAQEIAAHLPLRLQALEDSAWLEIPAEAWESWLAQSGVRASLIPTEKRI
jgi:putative ABC transport system ATP-binding protein